MKNKLFIILILTMISTQLNAQLAIGKSTVTNSSVLMEFGNETKGIILPGVIGTPGAVGGTFIFDRNDNSVKVWEGKNSGLNQNWTNLTQNGISGIAHSFINLGSDSGEGVIIGSASSLKPGVLVFESTTKALVLPNVQNPHLTMPGTIAGTIVYDASADMLAVFDGANWSYWN